MSAGFVLLEPAAGKVTGTNSNMPLLVRPSVITNIGTLTTAQANSVRFYTDVLKTTEIAREIVSADEIHVRVPSVTSTTDIWMDWDGVRSDYAVTATFGRNAVWSDYRQLYHLSNNTDATSAGVNLTTSFGTPSYVAGKIGNAIDGTANNTGTLITSPSTSNWDGNQLSTGVIFSCWLYIYDFNPALEWFWGTISTGGTRWNIRFRKDSPSTVLAQYDGSFPSSTGWNSGQWYYVVMQKEGSNVRMYRDGVQVASVAYSTVGGTTTASAATTMLDESTGVVNTPADVMLDEVRIRYGSFSTNWISTEYQNQNDNGSFWVATPVGGVAATTLMMMGVGR